MIFTNEFLPPFVLSDLYIKAHNLYINQAAEYSHRIADFDKLVSAGLSATTRLLESNKLSKALGIHRHTKTISSIVASYSSKKLECVENAHNCAKMEMELQKPITSTTKINRYHFVIRTEELKCFENANSRALMVRK